ncbi:MAG: type I DNA topoisomerase [Planctomycetota bacterium]|jgi:DNA topoisomerase-1|nr:type I DNA topoisomerase [Planctomycetota bacterium]MDP7249240.1 type I DNA topoisomerase [Planctomycetota bacterium]
MAKKLVIVESPAKAKTINKYLGKDFKVEASMGHVRDLPSSRLGIDVENDFLPDYEIMDSRKGTVNSLKKAAKNCEALYLAPDPDREGEAIAWHLANTLGVPPEKTFRVTFNEITKKAVQDAFNSPSKIDESKVNAQQARRIWDRLVGYKISPILWKKVAKGLSAGRVQSVAVRLVVEREREIAAFNPEEYWRILATLSAQAEGSEKFIAELRKLDNEDVGLGKKVHIKSEEEATALREELEKADYKVVDIRKKRQKNNPVPPFITSTLQQQASTRAGYTAQRTMRIAQQLYEGMEVGGEEGPVGLITYMRTDSVRISDEALASARELIGRDFGPKYLPEEPNFYKSKSGAQEAHEAIRPTDVERTPEKMKQYLDNDQFKLYKLVWDRTVASQMTPAEYDITEVDITAGRALFLARGRVMLFDGHLRVSGMPAAKKSKKKKSEEEDDSGPDLTNQVLPPLENDEELDLKELSPSQHFTKPPARYNEASLVRILEREGIGRPSTYASIISTIQSRGYVKKEGRNFQATDLGILVTDKLVKHFPDILDLKFTSGMEESLDRVEEGGVDWIKLTSDFYKVFEVDLEKAVKEMRSVNQDLAEQESPDIDCPKCGTKMVIRISKNGKFLGCPKFPKCRSTMPMPGEDGQTERPEPEVTDEKCEDCGKPMVVRTARRGRSKGSRFLACSGYPDCKGIKPFKIGHKCQKEECEGELVEKAYRGRKFYGCSNYPDCDFVLNKLPEQPDGGDKIEEAE